MIACLILSRHFRTVGARGWTITSALVGIGLLALLADPTAPLMTVRMALGSVVTLLFLAALCYRTLRQHQ